VIGGVKQTPDIEGSTWNAQFLEAGIKRHQQDVIA
jgi:hypothetical protein